MSGYQSRGSPGSGSGVSRLMGQAWLAAMSSVPVQVAGLCAVSSGLLLRSETTGPAVLYKAGWALRSSLRLLRWPPHGILGFHLVSLFFFF